jgi:hypothetical protein
MVFADLKNTVKGLNSETHITPATKVIYHFNGVTCQLQLLRAITVCPWNKIWGTEWI